MKQSISESFKPYGSGAFWDDNAIFSGKINGKGNWTYIGG
jgi:hypothetical protein